MLVAGLVLPASWLKFFDPNKNYWLGIVRSVTDVQCCAFQNKITNWRENTDKIHTMREIDELDPQNLG